MTADEILEWLEAEFGSDDMGRASFDQLEDYFALADARLTAFRDNQMWVVAIEAVRFYTGQNEYTLSVWLFGNCLKQGEECRITEFECNLFTLPRSWNSWSVPDIPWDIDRAGFALRWRGKRFDFAPSPNDLQAANIQLSRREQATGQLTPPQMLRYVCHALDHSFFLSEDALRNLLDSYALPFEWKYDAQTQRQWWENEIGEFEEPPIPSVILQLIIQTREWCHPRTGSFEEDEASVRNSFGPLAETLASGDLSYWQNQDTKTFNSHWRFWADVEAEQEREHDATVIAEQQHLHAFLSRLPPEERVEQFNSLRGSVTTYLHRQGANNDLTFGPMLINPSCLLF